MHRRRLYVPEHAGASATAHAPRGSHTCSMSGFVLDGGHVSRVLVGAALNLWCHPCAHRSLCIIDEFGKGTLSTDGIGLLCATLRHFADRDPRPPPRVVAVTHFSEVLNPAYLPRRACPLGSLPSCCALNPSRRPPGTGSLPNMSTAVKAARTLCVRRELCECAGMQKSHGAWLWWIRPAQGVRDDTRELDVGNFL